MKKQLVIGILAHVDAGKTTLSEGILYTAGSIRAMGRVDNQDAFLDTYALEKQRGITIFSKQARFSYRELEVTLLDTPGHVDFSAEMERTLQVLDYAVLVISGADGVQGHTVTLWKLLQKHRIPVFLFVNKMDQEGTEKQALLKQLQKQLDERCISFAEKETDPDAFYEETAMCEEMLMNAYLENGVLTEGQLQDAVADRKLFPCYFGSALKMIGVDRFLDGLARYVKPPEYGEEFGARVFKIARDEQGNRLTYMKITGGSLKVRQQLKIPDEKGEELQEEKVSQIRLYSGNRYETTEEAGAGTVCAVTGLRLPVAGQGLGAEEGRNMPLLVPVLTYRILLPEATDPTAFLPKLRQLEEEEPELHVAWDEENGEIQVQVMGQVQTEILKQLIQDRFGVSVSFGTGVVLYRETIANTVWGVGHYEPLRHYAEVHLKLEPMAPGSGLHIALSCPEEMLAKNWQRLVATHLLEREYRGVLAGFPITDMKITLVAGRAHLKHTEGGDFRQATYRAVRQGLMEAESVLLEPWYQFRLEVPDFCVGRAMSDLERMQAEFTLQQTVQGEDAHRAVLTGIVPVTQINEYQRQVLAYTKGTGRLFCSYHGYLPCHNAEEIIARVKYDPLSDPVFPPGSVFCSHGAGYYVPWDQVKEHCHVPLTEEEKGDAGEDKEKREPEAKVRQAMAVHPAAEPGILPAALGQAGESPSL